MFPHQLTQLIVTHQLRTHQLNTHQLPTYQLPTHQLPTYQLLTHLPCMYPQFKAAFLSHIVMFKLLLVTNKIKLHPIPLVQEVSLQSLVLPFVLLVLVLHSQQDVSRKVEVKRIWLKKFNQPKLVSKLIFMNKINLLQIQLCKMLESLLS